MRYYKKIVGERLYLSPVSDCDEDAEKYIAWMNDETVAKNFGQYGEAVASKKDLNWLYEPPADMRRFAMVLLEGDVLLGSIALQNIDHFNRNAFFGIFIGDERQRNKGYGAEAIRLLLNYGFRTLNLHSVLLSVHADMPQAIACYKKVGFKECGRRREYVFKDGKYADKIYMDILEREYQR